MEQYLVTGMTCAACSSRVEKAVSAVPGVESCAVSLLTNSMGVSGTASPQAIIAAVEGAKGRAGEGGVRGGQRIDERFPGEGAVLVRHAVLALERAAEELQAVVPPDLVLVGRPEHPRQVAHDAVGQFGQGEEFVGGGIAVRRFRKTVLLPAGFRAKHPFAEP